MSAQAELKTEQGAAPPRRGGLSVGDVLAALVLLFGSQQMLLWRFLDFAPAFLYVAAAAALAAAAYLTWRFAAPADGPRLSAGPLAACFAIAFLLCLLGGQGGFFYANEDWQVRNSQLFDMIGNPWPHSYAAAGGDLVQRAQIGMFLIPALVGKVLGAQAGNIAVLVQNSFILGLALAIASTLFKSARSRALALAVIVLFSGMDILGQEIRVWFNPLNAREDHLERWIGTPIYSSHIAQIFWAPHHSLTGWLGAALYLLWRQGQVRLAAVLVLIPLFPLWSPLAVMGLLPFLAHAGLATMARRELRWKDVATPALTTLLGLPTLAYLGAGTGVLNHYLFPVKLHNFVLFHAIEVLPYLAAAVLIGWKSRFGGITLFLAGAALLLIPNYQIGDNGDFQMRASIPAMFILAVVTADVLLAAFAPGANWFSRLIGAVVVAVLAVGCITGWREVRRAVVLQPSPRVECSLPNSWEQLEIDLPPGQVRLYVAPVASLPKWMQAERYYSVSAARKQCWTGPWKSRR